MLRVNMTPPQRLDRALDLPLGVRRADLGGRPGRLLPARLGPSLAAQISEALRRCLPEIAGERS